MFKTIATVTLLTATVGATSLATRSAVASRGSGVTVVTPPTDVTAGW